MSSPDPISLDGGPKGLLLIHGFTGSPTEWYYFAPYFHQQGYTVTAIQLPGHGTNVADLNTKTWQDWIGHAQSEMDKLVSRTETVFVAGLSLGSLITLYLAAHNSMICAAAAYSPAIKVMDWRIRLLPILKRVMPTVAKGPTEYTNPEAADIMWLYASNPTRAAHEVIRLTHIVRRDLPRITCPLLVVQSTADTSIAADCCDIIASEVGSTRVEVEHLHNSCHVITVDAEWEHIAAHTHQFFQDSI